MIPKPQTHNGDLTQLPNALAFLRDQKVWVCWRWFWNGRKWTKPPYRADNANINASTSNRDTWGSYEQALGQVLAGTADGIGIALCGRDIGGIDLDHCRDPVTGDIADWAHEYLDRFPGAYAEVTVSGAGLGILGTSSLPGFARKFRLPLGNGEAVELFSNSTHYLTTSFNQIKLCDVLPPIGDGMTAIATTLGGGDLLNGADLKPATLPTADDAAPVAPTNEPPQPWSFAEEIRLRSALAAIPANEQILGEHFGHSHDAWVKIGRAVAWLGWGERGYGIFRDWSSQSTHEFNEKGLRTQLASFERTRNTRADPITIGTVYYCAKQFGWTEQQYGSADQTQADTLRATSAENIEMSGIEWFWPGRFALGKIGLIAGLPDTGKGQIAAFLAAAATATIALPCNEGMAPQGNVLWFNAEDDVRDTIKPRLLAAGADPKRVHFISGSCIKGKDKSFSLVTDLPLLQKKIQEIGSVVLVIIDPMSAYLGIGKVDSRQTTDVRSILTPLKELAEQLHVLVLGIAHFNKKDDIKSALLRVSDSIAYVAAARHVYAVLDDPEDNARKLFVKAKNNLAPDKTALRYGFGLRLKVGHDPKLNVDINAPYIEWLGQADLSANDAMQAAGGQSGFAKREAREFLEDRLEAGPAKAEDVIAEADQNGIAKRTLYRVKKELKIKSRKAKELNGDWMWELPKIANAPPREKEWQSS